MAAEIKAFDFYLLRVPRLPSEVALRLNEHRSKEEAWNYVMELLCDQEILDALHLASGDMFDELLQRMDEGYTPAADKVLSTLYKYLSRMAVRPTPYGKFSGVALGEINEFSTSIELSGDFIPSFRFDMDFIGYLSRRALEELEKQHQLVFFTNSTLLDLETSDYFRYIDFREVDKKRYYQWAKVLKNPLLNSTLDLAKGGRHFKDLEASLPRFGVSKEKAYHFLCKLINLKLLVSELEPTITGYDNKAFVTRLKEVCADSFLDPSIRKAEECLQLLNKGEHILKDVKIREELAKPLSYPIKDLFQVDTCVICSMNQLNKKIVKNLASELEELVVLNKASTTPDLASFCRKFTTRYGDKEVPLLEAINPETGIGYGEISAGYIEDNPLLQGLGTPHGDDGSDYLQSVVQNTMSRYANSDIKCHSPIELDHNDIKALQIHKGSLVDHLPVGFFALGNLLVSQDFETDDKGYYFNLSAAGGVSSIPLMTRFSHLDENIEDKLRECTEWEEVHGPDVIFAEIVYLPESRAGNILSRPRFFKYEIPIIGQSGVENDFIIPLDDLFVSVRYGKVILRSKRLNKQIIPRLSSAHNFHYGMVIYRFLCDLQYQSNNLDLSWAWGEFSERPFLPRITYKHIILSRARWSIPKIHERSLEENDDHSKVKSLKERYGLPDLVLLAQGDNELLLDLRNPLGAEILMKELRKRDLILYEYLFSHYGSPVRDTTGVQYNNELIIPFKVDKLIEPARFGPNLVGNVPRSFHLGTEWMYVKIYCGVGESDRVLSDGVMQLSDELVKEQLIEKWFFIRFFDPDPHIRLRFLIRKENGSIPFQHVVDCINKYLEPFMDNGTVHRLVYDIYDRELERYGEAHIESCESIFYIDSTSVLQLLPSFRQKEGGNLRWLAGMQGVEDLLVAFSLNIKQRIALLTTLRDAFMTEFQGYKKLKYKLDKKYRQNRNIINDFFHTTKGDDHALKIQLFRRLTLLEKTVSVIKNSEQDDKRFADLISSLSHMYINRLFPIKQRENEMVIYHFMLKHYQGIEKRNELESTERTHENLVNHHQ